MNSRGILTLFKKEIQRFKEVWLQTVLAPVITNVLFMVVFGLALAERSSFFEGISYLQVLIPGLVAMGIMMNAYQNPIGSLMIAKYTNVITEILMIPMKGFEVVLSYIAAGVVRGFLVGAVTLIVGLFFSPIPFAYPGIILLFAVLLGGIFSSLGAIVGILAPDFDKSATIQNFILTPLIYLGGVFYSVQSLPDAIGVVSRINPIFYLIDGFRFGFIGVGDTPLVVSLIVTIVTFLLAFGIASWMFQTGYKLRT